MFALPFLAWKQMQGKTRGLLPDIETTILTWYERCFWQPAIVRSDPERRSVPSDAGIARITTGNRHIVRSFCVQMKCPSPKRAKNGPYRPKLFRNDKLPMESKKGPQIAKKEKITYDCVHFRHGVCRYGHGPCRPCALQKTKGEQKFFENFYKNLW